MWPGKDIVLAFGLLSLCIGSALGSVFLYMAPIYLDRFRGFHLVLLLEISCFSTGPSCMVLEKWQNVCDQEPEFSFLTLALRMEENSVCEGITMGPESLKPFLHNTDWEIKNSLSTTAFQFSICTKLQSVFMDRRFSWMLVMVLFLQESIILGYWVLVPFCS